MNHYTSPTSINFPAVGIALPAAVSPTLGEQTSTTELQSPCKGSKLFWFRSCPKMVTIKTRNRDHDTDYEPPSQLTHQGMTCRSGCQRHCPLRWSRYLSVPSSILSEEAHSIWQSALETKKILGYISLSYWPSDFSEERPCSESDILSGRLGYHTFSCGFSGECNACHNTFRDVML